VFACWHASMLRTMVAEGGENSRQKLGSAWGESEIGERDREMGMAGAGLSERRTCTHTKILLITITDREWTEDGLVSKKWWQQHWLQMLQILLEV
jgi:hypothetical protein